ncbi:MAG TPA: hypothetical protein VIW94_03615 [Acidimicrobiia bacterium]
MTRLKRFEEYRFVGARDTMTVYDTDDADQVEAIRIRIESEDLLNRKLLQTFGPDTLLEARNRSFSPAT